MRVPLWGRQGGALLMLCALGVAAPVAAAQAEAGKNPVVLELFTSEGCSSCPPVDRWIERLDAGQPLAGADIIVLSEHVNYWDHLGWKDPYSSAALTERQEGYVRLLGLSGVYTPQVVLDGVAEINPQNAHQVGDEFRKAAAMERLPVQIENVHVGDGAVTGRVMVQGNGSKHGNVLVAVALNRTQTDVLAGENDGAKLTNVAVVQALVKIGKMDKGKGFDQSFRVPMAPGEAGNLRVVALVQEGEEGPIIGAGMTKVTTGKAEGR
jgi:hypothetical protein